jgi:hypothetical protein
MADSLILTRRQILAFRQQQRAGVGRYLSG